MAFTGYQQWLESLCHAAALHKLIMHARFLRFFRLLGRLCTHTQLTQVQLVGSASFHTLPHPVHVAWVSWKVQRFNGSYFH